jgi:hypothetical protein
MNPALAADWLKRETVPGEDYDGADIYARWEAETGGSRPTLLRGARLLNMTFEARYGEAHKLEGYTWFRPASSQVPVAETCPHAEIAQLEDEPGAGVCQACLVDLAIDGDGKLLAVAEVSEVSEDPRNVRREEADADPAERPGNSVVADVAAPVFKKPLAPKPHAGWRPNYGLSDSAALAFCACSHIANEHRWARWECQLRCGCGEFRELSPGSLTDATPVAIVADNPTA